jgi:hypothetical protein
MKECAHAKDHKQQDHALACYAVAKRTQQIQQQYNAATMHFQDAKGYSGSCTLESHSSDV